MRCTTLITLTGIVTLSGLSSTGCVRHDRYDTLREANSSLTEQLVRAETERDAAINSLEGKDRQLAQANANLAGLQDQYKRLSGELDSIATRNTDLLDQVTGIKIGPLPIEVQRQFAALANAYPDDMWFDAESGMVRFGSDFTFSSGVATVKQSATAMLQRVSDILNSSGAASFEIVIVGHTDNVKPKSSAIRYPSNWDLSAARAISVAKALSGNGVAPYRIEVAGYGEHRPLVANRPDGTPENRRVEIYLQPMTEAITWTSTEETSETVDATEEPMK
ncbi:MAG: OmpA family protein [Phycisphaerales bacterium]|jgi:chemotaxis protein MotB|nr:OmpA family protein [Phycisphaerales bacterium]MDP6987147.1 OmpA family protein [Phycisphaerales bacterium]